MSKDIEYVYFKPLPFKLGGRGNSLLLFLLDLEGYKIKITELADLTQPDWQTEKKKLIEKKLPGHLPYVNYDGIQMFGHSDIARFFSRITGSYGKDPKADYHADYLNDYYADFRSAWATGTFGNDEIKKNYANNRPSFYAFFENQIKGDYLTGDKPIWVDYFLASLVRDDHITFGATGNLLEKYPKVAALQKRIFGREKVAKRIKELEQ